MANHIIIRNDTAANWAADNPVLDQGEMGIQDGATPLMKVGDGVTPWLSLPFASSVSNLPTWTFVDVSASTGTLLVGEWAVCSPPAAGSVLNLPTNPVSSQTACRVELANNSSSTTSYIVKTTDGNTITYAGSIITGSTGLSIIDQGEIRDFTWDDVDNTWRVS